MSVAVTKTDSYNQLEVTASIRRHFELLGLASMITPKMRVLLKPNLLMKRRPEEITTTHPAVMAGIIVCLQELGVTDITIADSPGGPYTKLALAGIYEASGMKAVAAAHNVKINQEFGSFERQVKNGVKVQRFTLIDPVANADFIINVAKLKTHAMTTLSGAVKNLFGTVPGLMKPEFHFRFPDKMDFSHMLVDLCETVKPNVSFVDAIIAMEGDGPSGGTPKQVGMIVSGFNPYQVDVVLTSVIGLKPQQVPYLSAAIGRSLCVSSIDKINIIGDTLKLFSDYKMPSVKGIDFLGYLPKFMRSSVKPIIETFFVSKPIIRKKLCIGCGKCAESCPAKTISLQSRLAVIDYSKCIKCFCCHEMCPVKAIDIKRFKLFDR